MPLRVHWPLFPPTGSERRPWHPGGPCVRGSRSAPVVAGWRRCPVGGAVVACGPQTVRRYVMAAEQLGLARDGGEGQLTDVLIGMVVEAVRPHRSDGHGAPWRLLAAHHGRI